jgi:Spy/CpxP family protein refolding chaperone
MHRQPWSRSFALVLAALLWSAGFAAPRAAERPARPGREEAALELTEAQRRESARVLEPFRNRVREAARAAGQARRALFEATHKDPFDETAIRAAAARAARCEEDLAVVRGQVAAALRTLLTPEQRASMEVMVRAMAESMEQRAEAAGSLVDLWVREQS